MITLFGHKGAGSAGVECTLEMAGQPYRLVIAVTEQYLD